MDVPFAPDHPMVRMAATHELRDHALQGYYLPGQHLGSSEKIDSNMVMNEEGADARKGSHDLVMVPVVLDVRFIWIAPVGP